MKLFGVDLSRDVAIIAEVGVNHEGDVDVAARLVEMAARSGAHAVKFQSYTPERFIGGGDTERLERVRRFGLNEAAHRRLARAAADNGIAFLSSAISEDWVPLLAELCPAIKIASGDVTFEPVIRAAAETGKPVIVSTGAADTAEVDRTIAWFRDAAGVQDISDRLALLHCVACYPADIEEANLSSISFLADRYKLVTGWSNHVIGSAACIVAVALGARIVEVHFTDHREGRTFRDHSLSFEPAELTALVATLQGANRSLGSYGKQPSRSENDIRLSIRKGLVAARDLPAGTVLHLEHICFARPAFEFDSNELNAVIGRTLLRSVGEGEILPRASISLV